MNNELVDLAGVEKRSDDAGASHHPDMLAFFCAQTLYEFLDRLFDKFKPVEDFLRRLA